MWAGLSQLLMVKVLLCKKITVLGQFLGELYDLKVSHGFAGSVTCHGLWDHIRRGRFRGCGVCSCIPYWLDAFFVTFNFCPIIWILGRRLIPCVVAWVQKQKHWATEHALMTEADTDRSLQLVLDQGRGTPIWRAARRPAKEFRRPQPCSLLPVDNHSCIRQPVCIWCSANGGGNVSGIHRRQSRQAPSRVWAVEATLQWRAAVQRNHRRLHWMHTQHAMHPYIQTYPSCCRCSPLYPSPLQRQSVPFPLSNG